METNSRNPRNVRPTKYKHFTLYYFFSGVCFHLPHPKTHIPTCVTPTHTWVIQEMLSAE